ncbi:SgcJ/EcaC family oxidoreductase [Streptomyces himalayensis]|uniref:SgcJ/EcaC family oxidoreductase n=1 Tax=Streptomyces himalayensis subsp. himalayensis TaxID=2756131 RepID=A0A7W0DI84_9ACTN|nr:SgcJ/EcaC family oxidoreductase [Streptomyces himalayensis]MBA2945133.1 SgcJ/EcaC family oxidoreductase [Streptomyces himalayensis subsp. himalayensis]
MTRRSISKRAAIVTATALVAAGTLTVGVGVAGGEYYGKPGKTEIAGLFDDWNAALQTGDAEKVAGLYASDAVLLPTVSNEVRVDRAGIVDYFEHFLQNKPVGTKVKTHVDVLDANSAIDTGVYAFALTDHETGEKRTVEARYTYAYEKVDGEWKIVNHHSSAMPEG